MTGGFTCAPSERAQARKHAAWARMALIIAAPAMVFAATQSADVYDHGDDQNEEVNAGYGLMVVDHPGVSQRRQREEEETEQGNQ